jgi:hypothetical protein
MVKTIVVGQINMLAVKNGSYETQINCAVQQKPRSRIQYLLSIEDYLSKRP